MSESNLKIQKMKKSSGTAQILAKIIKILCIAVSVIAIGCGCWFIGARSYFDQEFAKAAAVGAFTEEEFRMQFSGSFLEEVLDLVKIDSTAVSLGISLIVLGILLICFSVMMHFIGKVFWEIKESYSPFQPEIVKNLKVVFVLITLFTLESSLLLGALVGFSLWCVLQIFEYGCELQRQSDETL